MNLLSRLSKISPFIRMILQEIGEVGTSQPVYVVGGFVRDLLLGRENFDLDVVLEGDAIRFAHQLAEAWGGGVQAYPRFGTATVTRPDGLKIDFVSARSETYARPGALPSVKYGTLEADLQRRDFSINALALRVDPGGFGEIADCTGGLHDLSLGRIRSLHDRSFTDDPTRIFRAIRYEQRYRFQIVEADQKRIRRAVDQGVLNRVSGQRIRHEIDRILLEAVVPAIIGRMQQFNLFRAIHPAWKIPQNFGDRWRAAQQAIDWGAERRSNERLDIAAIRWMPLLNSLDATEAIGDRLALEKHLRLKLIAEEQLRNSLAVLTASSRPSQVYQLLHHYPIESLVFAMAQPGQPDWRVEKIKDYLIHLRHVHPLITGDNLIQLGLKPGPAFAALLWKAFAAQLDGKVSTQQEAYRFLGY